jgi:glycerophosphoryl diester phosphodiesterase
MDDGTWWIGEEFGPFLLHVSAAGVVMDPPVEAPGVRSPDNPLANPPDAAHVSPATVGRSRGFEGLAWYPKRHSLVALLEGGLVSDEGKASRLLEFDPARRRFTGVQWMLPFEQAGDSFTELVGVRAMMAAADDESYEFVTVERDNRQGADARFKRVWFFAIIATMDRRHDPSGANQMMVTRRHPSYGGWSLDLLGISDPDHLASASGSFTFPFITPEALWPMPDGSIVILNDNNYPGMGGRGPELKDNTEFIRVRR